MKRDSLFLNFIYRYSYEILLLIFMVWMSIGIFPLSCYESDSMHIIMGCDIMYNQGFVIPPTHSYVYEMQPLITYTVVGVKSLLPILTCEQIYCLLTALCSLGFIVLSVEFVHKITSFRREWILFALFLIPESFAIAMYPNSSAFAGVLFVGALNLLYSNRLGWAMALLAIAPLYRIDVLIAYPVVFPLFWLQGRSFRESLLRSLWVAGIVLACLIPACWVLQANPLTPLLVYDKWYDGGNYVEGVKFAVVTFYTILYFILIPIAVTVFYRNRNFKLLLLCVVPVVLVHAIQWRTGCATKHYLYLIPFVALLGCYAITSVYQWARKSSVLKWSVISLFVVFLIVGVRMDRPDAPWRNCHTSDYKLGPYLQLYQEDATPYKVSLGIGTGQVIPTYDEYMLMSGNLFYPFYIHRYKEQRDEVLEQMNEVLAQVDDYAILACTHEDGACFSRRLLADGYRFELGDEEDLFCRLQKGEKQVWIYLREIYEDLDNSILEFIGRVGRENSLPLYITTFFESQEYLMESWVEQGIVRKEAKKLYRVN